MSKIVEKSCEQSCRHTKLVRRGVKLLAYGETRSSPAPERPVHLEFVR